MTGPPAFAQGPRWKAWLGLGLVVPLAAASGAAVYGLYRHVASGQLATVGKSYGSTSRTIVFADSPVWFLVFMVLHVVFAAMLIVVTVVVARLFLRRLRVRG